MHAGWPSFFLADDQRAELEAAVARERLLPTADDPAAAWLALHVYRAAAARSLVRETW